MDNNVYFMDFRAKEGESLIQKLGRMLSVADMGNIFGAKDLVAVKVHFGAPGNTSTVRPMYIRKIVQAVKEKGGLPFLTDTNVLSGISPPGRGDTANHIQIAIENGYAYSVVDAPIVIADGLRGLNEVVVTINQKRFEKVSIAADIYNAEALISVAHFKLHEGAGFGGALKNIAIGCSTRGAKLRQHSTVPPQILAEKCRGVGRCISHCPADALALHDGVVHRDDEKCRMCAVCFGICPNHAFEVAWIPSKKDPRFYHETKMEHALGALANKKGRAFFINLINQVSPDCDCFQHNDAPVVRDIGIVASKDPVAIDQASIDLVNQEQGLPNTAIKTNMSPGEDKIRGIYPHHAEYEMQLDYAQEMGIGSRHYQLIKV